MGKTSKFSFPIPGRRHTPSEDNLSAKSTGGRNTSKAQRLLGTESDLNIDSRGAYRSDDEVSWGYPGSRGSHMSIAVSESTNSGSGIDSRTGGPLLENDGGPRLNGKASSTLLGKRLGEDELTTSDSTDRLRREGSSSTLRSYYDRQKSPLAISQQTSNSSARDLALRKGLPRVVPASPLLKVETFVDTHGDMLDSSFNGEENAVAGSPPGRGARKKPARLDFSLLVPKSMRHGERSASTNPSPSSTSASTIMSRPAGLHHPDSARRRLVKMLSRESIPMPNHVADLAASPMSWESKNSLSQLYDHYEQLPIRSPLLALSPEAQSAAHGKASKTPDQETEFHLPGISKDDDSCISPSEQGPVWKNFRWNAENLPPEAQSSAASVSSRNTKTSRHTSTSALSQVDLREKSVLSLSSDSEEEDIERPLKTPDNTKEKPSRTMSGASESPGGSSSDSRRRHMRQKSTSTTKSPHRKGAMQETPFLTIPEIPTNLRLSGPWSPPMISPRMSPRRKSSRSSLPNRRSSVGQGEKRSVRTSSSVASFRTGREGSLQPTPPISPTSMEFRQSSEFSSRFMAVTKQEEALLEALRQKKARMREKSIGEHGSHRSPPEIPTRKSSVATSVTSDSGDSSGRQRVLLYLDTPLSQHQHIDTAEPSPDLSDFLTFGSDEDSTPRTSLVTGQKELPRPDSGASPRSARLPDSQLLGVPPSTGPRISAVGPSSGFTNEAQITMHAKRESGIGLMEEVDGGTAGFLLDDRERIWGVR